MDLAQLAKAEIVNTHTSERIPVMYNPEQYSIEQGNNFAEIGIPGLTVSPVQYVRGKGRTLSMELFFDSFERGEDVRRYSGRVVALLAPRQDTHAPPILLFTMGQFALRCVLADASQKYTMFLRDGTPVRATISVRFTEYQPVEIEIEQGFFIGPPTLHNITQGQTITQLAAEFLGDASAWREIAEANNIDDIFNIPAGLSLILPNRPRR
jgi:nucleoid-associated protein YgaU